MLFYLYTTHFYLMELSVLERGLNEHSSEHLVAGTGWSVPR